MPHWTWSLVFLKDPFWCFRKELLSWSYSRVEVLQEAHIKVNPKDTNPLFLNDLALLKFKELGMLLNHKNFQLYYYKYPIWINQNQWVYNVLHNPIQHYLAWDLWRQSYFYVEPQKPRRARWYIFLLSLQEWIFFCL